MPNADGGERTTVGDRTGSRSVRGPRPVAEGSVSSVRRVRLDRFVELARRYRGWSRSQLSERLGRDPSKLVPESGIPKLDFIAGIASALDWPLGEVAESVWCEDLIEDGVVMPRVDFPPLPRAGFPHPANRPRSELLSAIPSGANDGSEPPADATGGLQAGECRGLPAAVDSPAAVFAELDLASCAAHRAGDSTLMLRLARGMRQAARTATERAVAANREAGAWDLRGRYMKSLEAVQRGLAESGVRADVRLMLEINLANAHYTLWHLVEAEAIATSVLERFRESPPTSRLERVVEAFSRYVRGSSERRRMLLAEEPDRLSAAGRATDDLERARDGYMLLAAEFMDPSYEAVAHTCRGGLLECAAALGEVEAGDAVGIVLERLGEVADLDAMPAGDWLESFGWWAIYGCNMALRHLSGKEFHRAMAICTNKAAEIAERLDNWSMRERVFAMEHVRRTRVQEVTGYEPDWLLDPEDIRVLAGAMGRFPSFREIGWQILESARLFEDDA